MQWDKIKDLQTNIKTLFLYVYEYRNVGSKKMNKEK